MKATVGVIALLAVVAVFCEGCAAVRAPVVPPIGSVFNQTKAPLSTEFAETPVAMKHGQASAVSILFSLFSFGDCSLQAAAENGGLRKIYSADYEFKNILGLYMQTTVIAHGE